MIQNCCTFFTNNVPNEILWLLKQDTGGLRSRQLMRLGHELSSTQLLRIADWSWFKNTMHKRNPYYRYIM